MFAELIANDKPLFIHYDGKNYFPLLFTYPDTEFGDDLGTAADYRDPYLQKFLDEHHAIEIWPPIRFSYKTINDRPPSAFPSKPTWLLNRADCDFAAKNGYSQCGKLEYNWLGTDDQGRDVLARLIYGFRVSVLFGLVLTVVSSIIGVAAGAVQGYFGGWIDLLFQRFIEIWTPIRFSYKTINDNPPSAFPSKPTWMLNQKDCDFAAKNGYGRCGTLEYNWLGTDDQGRDVLARLIYGFRLSVLFGLVLTIVSSVIGVAAGAVQGYFGGWTDLLFQRFIEIWTSVPELYLLLIISSVLVPGFFVLLGILLLFSWVRLVGLVRAEFLRGRNFEYIQAARALGVSNRVIMFRHLLPNAMVATMTFLPFIMSSSVMTLTALDFLGFGLPPGSPSLGELLSQGKANVQAPWLGLTGFFTVALMLSLLIFIGEAVRDAFDPRKTYA
jgi:microcin C transport system permease protein